MGGCRAGHAPGDRYGPAAAAPDRGPRRHRRRGPVRQGRCILAWLGEWDEDTTAGLVELLAAAHEAGRLPDEAVEERRAAAAREESSAIDAAVLRYRQRLERRDPDQPGPGPGLGGPR